MLPQADNLKFLDSIKVFDGLNQKQKARETLLVLRNSPQHGTSPIQHFGLGTSEPPVCPARGWGGTWEPNP